MWKVRTDLFFDFNICRQQQVPADLDKPSETTENCPIRSKSKDLAMLTNILNS